MADEETLAAASARLMGRLSPKELLKVDTNPLQRPGQHEVLRTVEFPDPSGAHRDMDRRMLIDVDTLDKLLDIARASRSQRACLTQVSLVMQTRRDHNGHTYQVWMLAVKGPVVPERTILDDVADGGGL